MALRRSTFTSTIAEVAWLDAPVGVLAYGRDGVTVLLNAGAEPALLPTGEVLIASAELPGDGTVPVDTAVWVRTAGA